jgi:basic membrane lipoprotein Med (substrate-binding protein (PBP1-ABC) superfamily)
MAAKTPEQKAAEKAAKQAAQKTEALTDGLKAAGVELSGKETPEEIQALAEKNNVKVLSPEEVKAAENAAKNAAKNGDSITVKYRDHKGEPTERGFSKEVHGEDFAKLAEEFKATNAQRIIA